MIELRQHIGNSIGSGREVKLSQDMILVDERLVGFIEHRKDAPIQLIEKVSEAEQAEIEARVVAKFGQEPETVGPPIVVTEELLDALEGNDDE